MLVELGLVEQRLRAVQEVLDGATVTDVAKRNGVTRQTVHTWLWASSGLTDIHHQGHSPGKDVQNGDHGTEEAPSSALVHPGVQG